MFRVVAIRTRVIHMYVHIATHPLRCCLLSEIDRAQLDDSRGGLVRPDLKVALFESILESVHYLQSYRSRRHSDLGLTCRFKVMCFKLAFGAGEAVVGLHPGIIGSIGTSVAPGYEDPRRHGGPVCTNHTESHPPHWPQVFPPADGQL